MQQDVNESVGAGEHAGGDSEARGSGAAAAAAAAVAVVDAPSGLRFTPIKDAALRELVALCRVPVGDKYANGISWADGNRLVLSGDPRFTCLWRHVSNEKSKTLRKRYLQYVSPEEQCNKKRKWR